MVTTHKICAVAGSKCIYKGICMMLIVVAAG